MAKPIIASIADACRYAFANASISLIRTMDGYGTAKNPTVFRIRGVR